MLKRNTLILTGIMLLIGLQLVGVTYGRWASSMKVAGTVQTGSLEVVFENILTEDWVLAGDGSRYARADGDFAALFQTVSCSASLGSPVLELTIDEETDNPPIIDEEMTLEINGVYPGYGCLITFDVRSAGSVPVGLEFRANHPHPLISAFTCNGADVDGQAFLLNEGDVISCQIELQASLDGEGLAEQASYPLSYIVLAEPYSGP